MHKTDFTTQLTFLKCLYYYNDIQKSEEINCSTIKSGPKNVKNIEQAQ